MTVFQNRLTAPSSSVGGGFRGRARRSASPAAARADVEEHWSTHTPVPVEAYRDAAEQPPARARGFRVEPGDGYYIRATGGPGFGDPIERDPARVGGGRRAWVRVGRAGRQRAYGVALVDGAVDEAGDRAAARGRTRTRRRALAAGARRVAWVSSGGEGAIPARRRAAALRGARARRRRPLPVPPVRRGARRQPRQLEVPASRCSEAVVSSESIRNRIAERPAGDLVFRRYCCPACATQLDTEVALLGEPPRWNYRPLEVWRGSDGHARAPALPRRGAGLPRRARAAAAGARRVPQPGDRRGGPHDLARGGRCSTSGVPGRGLAGRVGRRRRARPAARPRARRGGRRRAAPAADRPDPPRRVRARALRQRGAAGAPPARDPRRPRHVVPAVLRAGGGQRPGRDAHARPCRRRRRLRRRRPEGLELERRVVGLRLPARPHRDPGGAPPRHQRVHRRHARCGRRHPPAARAHRHVGLQRGLPRRPAPARGRAARRRSATAGGWRWRASAPSVPGSARAPHGCG